MWIISMWIIGRVQALLLLSCFALKLGIILVFFYGKPIMSLYNTTFLVSSASDNAPAQR